MVSIFWLKFKLHQAHVLVQSLPYNFPYLLSHVFIRRYYREKLTQVVARGGHNKPTMTTLPRRVTSSSRRTLVMSAGL